MEACFRQDELTQLVFFKWNIKINPCKLYLISEVLASVAKHAQFVFICGLNCGGREKETIVRLLSFIARKKQIHHSFSEEEA